MNLAAKIGDIKSLMLEGKLVLLGDDGEPLKPSGSSIGNFTREACESFNASMNEVNSQSDTSGFVLLKENGTNGVVEPVVQTPIWFTSVVNNDSVNHKVNFRSFDSDKPTNDKAEVQIPLSSVLEVHSRFEFNFYGYFVGQRIEFSVLEQYVRNAWKKYGIIHAKMNLKGLFFFKFLRLRV